MKSPITFLLILLTQSLAAQLYLPQSESYISHPGFDLEYNEETEQASWVAYALTADECIKRFERSDRFKEDPKVLSGSAQVADYKGSGYDRGHLAPAADLSWSQESMQASFYYSNMSPQDPGFNRGIWKRLEEQVREWAVEFDSLQIATGPIIDSNCASIGPNQVAVPAYYYKVLLYQKEGSYAAIGLILPNQKSSQPLQSYALTVDSVEIRTGLDFFYLLPDSLESRLEGSYQMEKWW